MFKSSAAKASHAKMCAEIIRQARHDAYGDLGADYIDSMHEKAGGYEAYFRAILTNAYWSRVILDKDRVVALAIVDSVPDKPDTLNLSYLYTHKSARGSGLGSSLLDEFIAMATKEGYVKVTLGVYSGNTGARRLYASRGFRYTEKLAKPYYRDLGEGYKLTKVLKDNMVGNKSHAGVASGQATRP